MKKIERKIPAIKDGSVIDHIPSRDTFRIMRILDPQYKITEKIEVKIPKELVGIINCSNPLCVTNREKVDTKFKVIRDNPLEAKCLYCEKVYGKDELEIKRK